MGTVRTLAAAGAGPMNAALIGVAGSGVLLLVVWYVIESRKRKRGHVVYGDLLRKALKHTSYSSYLALSWSMLLVLSAFGSYRTSLHPNEPTGLILFGYALIAVWIGLIVAAGRERLRARSMVARHLAAMQNKAEMPVE